MKTFCIYGNCQANALAATLQICQEFKDTYNFVRTTPVQRIDRVEFEYFLERIAPTVDLLIYQPISEQFRGGGFHSARLTNGLKNNAVAISFPSIQFYGYHATSATLPNLSPEERTHSNSLFGLPGGETFHFPQLIHSFLTGLPATTAHQIFQEGLVGDNLLVQKKCNHSLAQLKKSEVVNRLDIRIHEHILNSYQDRQLFHSPRHPSGEILCIAALKVLEILQIKASESEAERMKTKDILRLPQYPLQSFLPKALNLKFSPRDLFVSKIFEFDSMEMAHRYYNLYSFIGANKLRSIWELKFSESYR